MRDRIELEWFKQRNRNGLKMQFCYVPRGMCASVSALVHPLSHHAESSFSIFFFFSFPFSALVEIIGSCATFSQWANEFSFRFNVHFAEQFFTHPTHNAHNGRCVNSCNLRACTKLQMQFDEIKLRFALSRDEIDGIGNENELVFPLRRVRVSFNSITNCHTFQVQIVIITLPVHFPRIRIANAHNTNTKVSIGLYLLRPIFDRTVAFQWVSKCEESGRRFMNDTSKSMNNN